MLEGTPISLPGNARRPAALVRDNLEAAQRGFVAMPLLVGRDVEDPTLPSPTRSSRST